MNSVPRQIKRRETTVTMTQPRSIHTAIVQYPIRMPVVFNPHPICSFDLSFAAVDCAALEGSSRSLTLEEETRYVFHR